MSDIFGKIFGKDKDKSHKEKGHHSGDKGSALSGTAKWSDFCEYILHYILHYILRPVASQPGGGGV